MVTELKRIADEIDRFIIDRDARLFVTIETGLDEAGLVGTRDAYLRLARVLVDFVADSQQGKVEHWDIGGLKLCGSSAIGALFDSSCEVQLDSMCLTASEQQTQEVSEYIKRLSPPS